MKEDRGERGREKERKRKREKGEGEGRVIARTAFSLPRRGEVHDSSLCFTYERTGTQQQSPLLECKRQATSAPLSVIHWASLVLPCSPFSQVSPKRAPALEMPAQILIARRFRNELGHLCLHTQTFLLGPGFAAQQLRELAPIQFFADAVDDPLRFARVTLRAGALRGRVWRPGRGEDGSDARLRRGNKVCTE